MIYMKTNKQINFLLISSILLISFSFVANNVNDNNINILEDNIEDNDKIREIKQSASWDLTGSPISIVGNSGWETTKNTYPWCSGSGLINDPYIIENVTIDGLGTGNCILVQSSNVYFKIRNCNLYNAGSGLQDAGIRLFSADNGIIENCIISENNENGIYLYIDCDYITIQNCIINSNLEAGIKISPSTSVQSFHKFINNTIEYYSVTGFAVSQNLQYPVISGNLMTNNPIHLNIQDTKFATIEKNILADAATYGILGIPYQCTIEKNIIDNCNTGFRFYSVSDSILTSLNTISKNKFINNNEAIELANAYSDNNIIWFNHFENNLNPILDDGTNSWDNGSIGNYWDEYVGSDSNNDGVGDSSYAVEENAAAPYDLYPLMISPAGPSNIIISGDGVNAEDWEWWKSRSWWLTGKGTVDEPYIIEDLNVNAEGIGDSLHIMDDLTHYFIIQNCYITGGEANTYKAGLKLNNTKNGHIIGNICINNGHTGIYLLYSNNTYLYGNQISFNGVSGVEDFEGNNNRIIKNTVESNAVCGIFIDGADKMEIDQNIIINHQGIGHQGIRLFSGMETYVNITENILNNNYYGIYAWGEGNDLIHNNTISSGYTGIEIYIFPIFPYGTFFNISHNLIELNSMNGINFDDTTTARDFVNIFGNEFLANTQHINKESSDDYTINFNNTEYGNIWDGYASVDENDDFIGDITYGIPGMAGYFDYLPLFEDGDDLAPQITNIDPENNEELENPPEITFSIYDAYGVDVLWYEFIIDATSLGNTTLSTNFIEINPTIWDMVSDNENIVVKIYANDTTSGHLAMEELSIIKFVFIARNPDAPRNVQGTAEISQVVLTWDAPVDNGGSIITNYRIYRSTTPGEETLLNTVGDISTYTDTDVINGQIYYYTLVAVNEIGDSIQSSEVSATPKTDEVTSEEKEKSGISGYGLDFLVFTVCSIFILIIKKPKNRKLYI